jgi:hypothetical protein
MGSYARDALREVIKDAIPEEWILDATSDGDLSVGIPTTAGPEYYWVWVARRNPDGGRPKYSHGRKV